MREQLAQAKAHFIEANNNYNENLTKLHTLKEALKTLESEYEARRSKIYYRYWFITIVLMLFQVLLEFHNIEDFLAIFGIMINGHVMITLQKNLREEISEAKRSLRDAEEENEELYTTLCEARELVSTLTKEVERTQTTQVDNSDIFKPMIDMPIETITNPYEEKPKMKQLINYETRY